jgi:uncharacterized protein (DUF697 family)
LPGCGTARFPKETYIEDLDLAQYDAFVLVVAKRVYEDDLTLKSTLVKRFGKDVHIVRSMVDQDVENARRDGLTPEETIALQRADLERQFQSTHSLWLVSSPYPRKFDFPAFEDALVAGLSERKRDKFIFAAQAYTDGQLASKREVASRYVKVFAGLAAANGFNPIPGADIAADIAIILRMNAWILKCYKLDSETLERLYGSGRQELPSAVSLVAKKMLAYGTREFVKSALKRQLGRMAGKELAKWVPVVGQVASAGLGFGLVHWMGRQAIDDAETAVRDIIFTGLEEP